MEEQTQANWIQELSEILQPYDAADFLTTVAALQLLPRNAERLLRPEALANVSASLLGAGQNQVSRTRLQSICDRSPLLSIADREDPAEQPFTEALSFTNGSYVVFPGITENATFTIRHLAVALTQLDSIPSQEFNYQANNAIGATLTVSDLVAKRAGLSRGVVPVTGTDVTFIPFSRILRQLKAVATFEAAELYDLVRRRGFDPTALEPLTMTLGSVSMEGYNLPESGSLDTRPLVRAGDRIIVAAPGIMLASLRHRLLTLAQEHDALGLLCERYRTAVWHTVTKSLSLLGVVAVFVQSIFKSLLSWRSVKKLKRREQKMWT